MARPRHSSRDDYRTAVFIPEDDPPSDTRRANEMRYDARTGAFSYRGKVFARGIAGHGMGLYNPDYDYKRNMGPPPKGGYNVSLTLRKSDTPGVGWALDLTPDKTNNMHGRNGFLIHFGHLRGAVGSLGCITFDTNQQFRDFVAYLRKHHITRLEVYDSKKLAPDPLPAIAEAARKAREKIAEGASKVSTKIGETITGAGSAGLRAAARASGSIPATAPHEEKTASTLALRGTSAPEAAPPPAPHRYGIAAAPPAAEPPPVVARPAATPVKTAEATAKPPPELRGTTTPPPPVVKPVAVARPEVAARTTGTRSDATTEPPVVARPATSTASPAAPKPAPPPAPAATPAAEPAARTDPGAPLSSERRKEMIQESLYILTGRRAYKPKNFDPEKKKQLQHDLAKANGTAVVEGGDLDDSRIGKVTAVEARKFLAQEKQKVPGSSTHKPAGQRRHPAKAKHTPSPFEKLFSGLGAH